jgi:sugar O-acyltransferase (sialic acid O-acetyltransferase NeuD family)
MSRLAILGASGHGKIVADAALRSGWSQIAFFDDRWPELTTVGPWEIVGPAIALTREWDAAIVAIGDNSTRLDKLATLQAGGVRIATIRHPASVVSEYAVIGDGSFIAAGAIVGAFAVVGEGAILNTGSTVDHDCLLAPGVHVSPGAHLGGNVRVGIGGWVGLGASVKHGVAIGNASIVGAGAAVVDDVADGVTVVGVPARALEAGATAKGRRQQSRGPRQG